MQDLTPGTRLSIKGAATRYSCSYSTAQKSLRSLWRQNFLSRTTIDGLLWYEGRQERLI